MSKLLNTYRVKGAYALLIIIFFFTLLAGCTSRAADESIDEVAFTYSDGIDDDGHWAGIKALDYIDIFEYDAMPIPSDVHQVSDDEVQSEIDYILAYYTVIEEITDRAVIEGDTVNIDYVGSIDGVEFDGGSTGGLGTEVIAGSLDYIDDFLIQIIGHMPGDTIDVEVTFPDDYHESSLQGKDAVFVTTLNHIVETALPELTDDFVKTTLSDLHGWQSVAEMREGIQKDYQRSYVEEYILNYMVDGVAVHSIPDEVMEYQVNAMRDYYQRLADQYEMDLSEFLTNYIGISTFEELVEETQEDNADSAKYSLVTQAVAEVAGITVDTEDIVAFFTEYIGTDDYSPYEEQFGLPYLMQIALQQKTIEFIIEHAVLL